MDFVVDEVVQLKHVDAAHIHGLLEGLAGHAVKEHGLAGDIRALAAILLPGLHQVALDVGFPRTIKDGRGEVDAEGLAGPTKVALKHLPDVHTGRHAEGVQHDVHGTAVGQVGHVLHGEDAADHALVAVAAGHLVTDLQLALHGHVALDGLEHARHQLVTLEQTLHALVQDVAQDLQLALGAIQDVQDLGVDTGLARSHGDLAEALVGHRFQHVLSELLALGEQLLALVVGEEGLVELLALQKGDDLLLGLGADDALLVGEILLPLGHLVALDLLGADVLFLALAGEHLDVHHGALDARGHGQAGILHVAGLLAEDGAEELLLGREDRLALGGDLAHQDVAVLDGGTGADDAAVIEVLEGFLTDLGDVAGDLFGAQLGVAGVDLELLDVDGGVEVFLHHALGDQDRVLEVVAAPGHVGHDQVAAQGQLAVVGAGAVGQDLAGANVLALLHEGGLVEAGVLVAAGELHQRVDVHAGLDALGFGVVFDAHHDAVGVHGLHDAGAAADHAGAGVLGGVILHAGAHDGGLGADERHGLTLHVGTHEGPPCFITFQEGDEGGGHRDYLLRADVH